MQAFGLVILFRAPLQIKPLQTKLASNHLSHMDHSGLQFLCCQELDTLGSMDLSNAL